MSDLTAIERAWHDSAERLADWALERVFVRRDRFGGYYRSNGETKKSARPNKVASEEFSRDLVVRHFRAGSTKDVLGAYCLTSGSNGFGWWLTVDIDAHSAADDKKRNRQYALHLYAILRGLGFNPLLGHWGTGGYHLSVFFSVDVPGHVLHAFGRWLVSGAQSEPWNFPQAIETFPKQPTVEKFGNWVRLIGRHHTHARFAAVFNGEKFVHGEEAVRLVLSCTGDSPDLILAEAMPKPTDTAPRTSNSVRQDGPDVFAEFNKRTSIDEVVQWHEAQGHRVTKREPHRVDFIRAGKDGTGQSFNVMVRDGVAITYSFSMNAGMPDHVGLSPAQIRCYYETGSCKTAHMARFADKLRDELGIPTRSRTPLNGEAGEKPGVVFQRPAFGESWSDPHRVARLFAVRYLDPAGRTTLLKWRDEYHAWNGAAWERKSDSDLDAEIARHAREVFVADLPYRVEEARTAIKTKPVSIYPVTSNVKGNIRVNLNGLLNHPDAKIEPPFWLPGANYGIEPEDVIAAPNGLFTLADIAEGRGAFSPPTPLFFTPNAIAFPVLPAAPIPQTWLRCLDEWYNGDKASIAGLQEWFGYLLSGQTAAHKVLFLIGPPRSGKGTILRVLTALVGLGNVASTSFAALAENFGLENLLGKRVGIIPDARLSRRSDSAAIVERILSISGEDPQSVNRKNRPRVTTTLRIRFVLASNEIPRLPDASGAIASRFDILHTPNSWLGREDTHLGEKLAAELPGILLWAAKGAVRLQQQGFRFTPNDAAAQHRRDLEDLSCPIKTFVRQCCTIGPEELVEIPVIYSAWTCWERATETRSRVGVLVRERLASGLPAHRRDAAPYRRRKTHSNLYGHWA